MRHNKSHHVPNNGSEIWWTAVVWARRFRSPEIVYVVWDGCTCLYYFFLNSPACSFVVFFLTFWLINLLFCQGDLLKELPSFNKQNFSKFNVDSAVKCSVGSCLFVWYFPQIIAQLKRFSLSFNTSLCLSFLASTSCRLPTYQRHQGPRLYDLVEVLSYCVIKNAINICILTSHSLCIPQT